MCSKKRYYGPGKSDYVFGEGIIYNSGGRALFFVPVSHYSSLLFRISKYLVFVSHHVPSCAFSVEVPIVYPTLSHCIHMKKKFRNKSIAYNSDGSVLLLFLDFKL